MDSGHALITAMLYGKLDGLSQETIFLFGRAGLLHLFSASGFHMGVALALAQKAAWISNLALPKGWAKYSAFLLSLSLMTFFGTVTEWSSPMVRAYAFATLLMGARMLEVRSTLAWVFVLSLLCSAVLGKGSTLSFLLSAFGMAGVLVAGKGLMGLALGPWLFTLPLVIWHFGLFSVSSPFWNLTAGCLIGLTILPLAILDLVLEAFGFPWRGLRSLAALGMEWIVAGIQRGEPLIGFSYWVKAPLFFTVALLLAGAYFWRRERPNNKAPWLLAGAALALPLFFPSITLALLDVGQGDSIFLKTQSGARMLVDAGPPGFKKFPAPVNKNLELLAIGPLDHLLITHGHLDHFGGAPSLLARHRVRRALWVRKEDLPALMPVLEAAERASVEVRFLNNALPPDFQCWLPPPISANESSPLCHAKLSGNESIWLTGDGGLPSETWLLHHNKNLPKAKFLKVGHHGSKGSSTNAFLQATGATVALISAGRKNRYGHPAKEVLERLEKLKMKFHVTGASGSYVAY